MVRITTLSHEDIQEDFLAGFRHEQHITAQWVQRDGMWVRTETDILRAWDEEKKKWIPEYLKGQLSRGGYVLGAFIDVPGTGGDSDLIPSNGTGQLRQGFKDSMANGSQLAGFCSVDGILLGECARYANLTMLFVDDRFQGRGIGGLLFRAIKQSACKLNAEKLFISAIPSVDTVAFYRAMGCADAEEIIPDFVDTEEDRYLECPLAGGAQCITEK